MTTTVRRAVAPADLHTVLLWRGGALEPTSREPAGAPLAADSWLVDEGRVRGYERHWARFGGWCEQLGTARDELERFRAAVTALLPRTGRWLPRLDLLASPAESRLLLTLRPVQAQLTAARVLLAAPGDPRGHPRRKGPDLTLLLALRADAVAAGADELVLRDASGRLLEGALNSLLWWEDGMLCATPDGGTLPSVTRALLLEIADERGVGVRRRSPMPAELDGCEAWLANAAHGICAVREWVPGGPVAGAPARAPSWRTALDATARHLDAQGVSGRRAAG